VILKQIRTI